MSTGVDKIIVKFNYEVKDFKPKDKDFKLLRHF
jgi:hypothetical protein